MTTSTAQYTARPISIGGTRQGLQRLGRSLFSVAAVMVDAIEASRALHSTHTVAGRRAVLDRFTADLARDTDRAAA